MIADRIPPIHLNRRVRASRATAWATITEPERVARWFAAVAPLGRVGDDYRVEFADGSVVVGTVLALDPGRRFMHGWRWSHEDDARTTRVTWAVEPMSGGSRIVLEHDGWAEASLAERDRDEHATSWEQYLDALRELLDPGLPEPPDEVPSWIA